MQDQRVNAAIAAVDLGAGTVRQRRCSAASAPAGAQQPGQGPGGGENVVVEDDMVQLDFNDVELSVVIDTIARLTGKNMIYDDRVRGRVTIVSPTKIVAGSPSSATI